MLRQPARERDRVLGVLGVLDADDDRAHGSIGRSPFVGAVVALDERRLDPLELVGGEAGEQLPGEVERLLDRAPLRRPGR